MKTSHTNILKRLDQIINDTVHHIHDFISSKTAFTRNRKLDAATLIKTTINMQGNSLEKELFDAFDNDDNGESLVSTSAYIQQKSKLSLACFEHILKEFNQKLLQIQLFDGKYRLFAIDGSDFNQPWNPDSKNIVKSHNPSAKPYCQVHVNALYDLLNNTYQDCLFQPRKNLDERLAAVKMLKRLNTGQYIVLMDRGYSSFNMIENCNRLDDCSYVIRTKSGNGAIKEVASLPNQECDQDISCRVTISNHYYNNHHKQENIHLVSHKKRHYKQQLSKNTQDASWDFENFVQVNFRACKIKINDPNTGKEEWEVLLTNLDRNDFPLERMKRLYHLRWGIESSFRKLKYDLGSVQFHSKQDKFVEMEILAHMIMFNTVSQINAQAYVPQKHTKYQYAINFKISCRIIQKKYRESSSDKWFEQILLKISRYTVPIRPGRKDQRKKKSKSAVYFLYRVA